MRKTVEEMTHKLVDNAWETLGEEEIKYILYHGFQGYENISDADIREEWKEVFECD